MNCDEPDDDFDEYNPRGWRFSLVCPHSGAGCIVGPCSAEERDELIELWGDSPDWRGISAYVG